MQKNKSVVARRAWNFLRLALLWARKGGVFKNRLMMDLRLLPKFIIKTLRNSNDHHRRGAFHYGERELSFDETPVIHVRMHRPSSLRFKMPNIPCINPQVDFDYDFDSDEDDYETYHYSNDDVVSRKSFLKGADDHHHHQEQEDGYSCSDVCDEQVNNNEKPCDEGIDLKAEQFIAKFYEQIKLQRQISYLQYNEMINRGAN